LQIADADLWWLPLDLADAELQRLALLLAPDEQTRAARLVGQARRRFVAARGCLRRILACYVDLPPAALRLRYEPQGKPRLDAPQAPLFNLAHSGTWLLCAVTHGHEVGVDLEQVRPLPNAPALAKRFFAPSEAAQLATLPDGQQQQAFFTCWTRREAYLKARGWGLKLPLPHFAVTLAPSEPPRLLLQAAEPAARHQWRLYDVLAPPGYVAALAMTQHKA
jgi:4'-phosphopantetheinyl transferase